MIPFTTIPVSAFCTIIDRKNLQIVKLLISFAKFISFKLQEC